MIGKAQSDGIQSPCDYLRDSGLFFQNQGEGPRPKFIHQRFGLGGPLPGQVKELVLVVAVDDEGVICRSALGGKDLGHRLFVPGICAQAVDSLGGKGDTLSPAQKGCG